jgi:hypothetical protein
MSQTGKKRLAHTSMIIYIYRYRYMSNPSRFVPVKTAVHLRRTPLLIQNQKVQDQKAALVVDPLMLLSEAVPMLGNPSYSTLRSWIKSGVLRVWRAGRDHFRVRLSEIERFRAAGEVQDVAR